MCQVSRLYKLISSAAVLKSNARGTLTTHAGRDHCMHLYLMAHRHHCVEGHDLVISQHLLSDAAVSRDGIACSLLRLFRHIHAAFAQAAHSGPHVAGTRASRVSKRAGTCTEANACPGQAWVSQRACLRQSSHRPRKLEARIQTAMALCRVTGQACEHHSLCIIVACTTTMTAPTMPRTLQVLGQDGCHM